MPDEGYTYILQHPPDHNLRRRLVIFFAQRTQNRLVEPRPVRQRTVRLDNDVAFLQPVDDISTVTPRVDLILPNIDLATARAVDILLEFIKMVNSVVGHSNRADLACFLRLNQGLPGAETGFFAAVGSVEEDPIFVNSL